MLRSRAGIVGVVALLATSLALGSDGDVRSSGSVRLATGRPAQLQGIVDGHVAGAGPWVGITPVEPTNGSSYPAGTTIVGNTITVTDVPQRLWFEIQLGGWGGDLWTWQIAVDESTFANGVGAALTRPATACTPSDTYRHPQCEAAYGPYSDCTNGVCEIGFQDITRPRFAVNSINAVNQYWLLFGSTCICEFVGHPDDGGTFYGGNLVLDAPVDAVAVYHIGIHAYPATFFLVSAGEISIAEYREAVVQIRRGRCCNLTEQVCMDDLTEGECDRWEGRTRWDEHGTCAEIDCVPTDGACCDRRPGSGNVCWLAEPDDCPQDPFVTYAFNVDCADVVCTEVTGACCEQIDGGCADDVLSSECTGTTDAWHPEQSCSEIQCPPDFAAIPTVSEWGLVVLALGLLLVVKVRALRPATFMNRCRV